MSTKKKYPPIKLSAREYELVANLIGPLEAQGISRSEFRCILEEANVAIDSVIDELLGVGIQKNNTASEILI